MKLNILLKVLPIVVISAVLITTLSTTSNFLVGPNPDDFTVEIERIEKNESLYAVFGIIENNSSKDWQKVGIEIEFYDENGVFLDETTGLEAQVPFVASGKKENFKLNIPSVIINIEGYKTTATKVVSGYGRKPTE